jgi:solute carrier family 25 carnitine/acylcarnitine transporter 20/29
MVYRSSGLRGLFAGFVPTVLRAAPSNAAIFWVYEMVAKEMKRAQAHLM